jgi:hypothetical protein
LRFIWLIAIVVVTWIITIIPIILLDGWIKTIFPAISWLPLVPLVVLVVTSASTVWSASYTYILYRKVVEDDASPA